MLIFCLISSPSLANMSNDVMKSCLEEHGYTLDKFDTFNFSKAASCHSAYRIGEVKNNLEDQRQFLSDHPWYKGTNWKWEERAEYTCSKIDTLRGSATVCSKPYYIN